MDLKVWPSSWRANISTFTKQPKKENREENYFPLSAWYILSKVFRGSSKRRLWLPLSCCKQVNRGKTQYSARLGYVRCISDDITSLVRRLIVDTFVSYSENTVFNISTDCRHYEVSISTTPFVGYQCFLFSTQ
jgi:hypothetical protein